MKLKEAVKWAKFEISQLQWVMDLLPKDKLKGEAKKRLTVNYERAEKRIEAQQTLISEVSKPRLEKLDEGKIRKIFYDCYDCRTTIFCRNFIKAICQKFGTRPIDKKKIISVLLTHPLKIGDNIKNCEIIADAICYKLSRKSF